MGLLTNSGHNGRVFEIGRKGRKDNHCERFNNEGALRYFRSMRVDKFLWCIRAFKTRSLAAESCRLGKVWINEELAKAAREVKKGDVIKVRKGPVHFFWQMIDSPTSRVAAKLVPVYATDVTPEDERKKLELLKLQMSADRPRGSGRPTKRERRELDGFFEPDTDDWFQTPDP